jgi:hypothetical protein
MQNRFSRHVARISEFRLHGVRHTRTDRVHVTGVTIHGRLTVPSGSFWNWLFDQFDVCQERVDHVGEELAFEEIRDRAPNAQVDYGIQWDVEGNALLTDPDMVVPNDSKEEEFDVWAGPSRLTEQWWDVDDVPTSDADALWHLLSVSESATFIESPPGTVRPSRN